MKKLLFLAIILVPLLASAQQETTTYRIDSIGQGVWSLITTTRYDKPDSTFSETSHSRKFQTRAAARQYVKAFFAERIALDSMECEVIRRRIAGAKASRQGLLDDLKRGASDSGIIIGYQYLPIIEAELETVSANGKVVTKKSTQTTPVPIPSTKSPKKAKKQ